MSLTTTRASAAYAAWSVKLRQYERWAWMPCGHGNGFTDEPIHTTQCFVLQRSFHARLWHGELTSCLVSDVAYT
jgi:hypothetical protein